MQRAEGRVKLVGGHAYEELARVERRIEIDGRFTVLADAGGIRWCGCSGGAGV